MGTAGYSWPFTYDGKTVIVVAANKVFYEYPVPSVRGVTGKYAAFFSKGAGEKSLRA